MTDPDHRTTALPDAPPDARPSDALPVAVVVKRYPRLSETFIAQELLGLQRPGLPS